MQVHEAMKKRKSVRSYQNIPAASNGVSDWLIYCGKKTKIHGWNCLLRLLEIV